MRGLRIAIAGGSVGGLFAGVLLHRAGFDVTVYERSRHGLEGRGAGLVPQREVFAILREIGCERLAHVGVVAHERIFLDRSGAITHVQHAPQTQMSWDVLFRSFRQHLPDERYYIGKELVAIEEGAQGLRLAFADGTQAEADLLIGADGVGSAVRGWVLGPEARPAYVGYATWRGLIPETALPPEAALLLERFAFHEMPRSHILGYLVPGADGSIEPGRRRYNWVWYRPAPEADGSLVRALTDTRGHVHPYSLSPGTMPAARREALHADAERLLPPPFAAVVRAEPEPFVQAIFDFAAARMVRERVALLGDAAFVARPHTAMGVSKAAADAMQLRDLLLAAPGLREALAGYDRLRRTVGEQIVAYGQRLGASPLG